MTKEELLALAYEQEQEYVEEVGQREFDCLIALIEAGVIDSETELARYV
jgi:hypothetical protein